MRNFDSGATRDTDENKLDFDGFLSPLVLHRYAEYLNKHRTQADGNLRDSDNWQKGIPLAVYMKSGFRHFFGWWANHRKSGTVIKEDIEESLCGLLFNAMGYLHEYLKGKAGDYNTAEIDGPVPKFKADDEVRIRPRVNMSIYLKMQCQKVQYKGIYIEPSGNDGHIVYIGEESVWFFSNEIFPVEDKTLNPNPSRAINLTGE